MKTQERHIARIEPAYHELLEEKFVVTELYYNLVSEREFT